MMCLAWLGEANTAHASTPEDMLNRADTLRNRGKMVQALTLYRSAMAEAISGCEMARAHVGMGGIQWNAGNLSEAKPHLDQAAQTCGTCPAHIRTGVSLELARLMVVCGNTREALAVLEREMQLGPAASQNEEVQLALVELHFVEGHWEEVWNATATMGGARAKGLRIQAGAMIGHPLSHLPLDAYLRTTESMQADYSTVMPFLTKALLDKRDRLHRLRDELGEATLLERHPEARGYLRDAQGYRLFDQRDRLVAALEDEVARRREDLAGSVDYDLA